MAQKRLRLIPQTNVVLASDFLQMKLQRTKEQEKEAWEKAARIVDSMNLRDLEELVSYLEKVITYQRYCTRKLRSLENKEQFYNAR